MSGRFETAQPSLDGIDCPDPCQSFTYQTHDSVVQRSLAATAETKRRPKKDRDETSFMVNGSDCCYLWSKRMNLPQGRIRKDFCFKRTLPYEGGKRDDAVGVLRIHDWVGYRYAAVPSCTENIKNVTKENVG